MTTTPIEARCAVCKRRLKRPTSSGVGPVCARKLAEASPDGRGGLPGPGLPPKRSQAPTRPPVTSLPGQTEIPLENP
jgi:hypothetical protein